MIKKQDYTRLIHNHTCQTIPFFQRGRRGHTAVDTCTPGIKSYKKHVLQFIIQNFMIQNILYKTLGYKNFIIITL